MLVNPKAQDILDDLTEKAASDMLQAIYDLAEEALKEERTSSYYKEKLEVIARYADSALSPKTLETFEDAVLCVTYAGDCANQLTAAQACCYHEDMEALCNAIESSLGQVVSVEGIFVHAKVACFDAAAYAAQLASSSTCNCVAYWAATKDELVGFCQEEMLPENPTDEKMFDHLRGVLEKMKA